MFKKSTNINLREAYHYSYILEYVYDKTIKDADIFNDLNNLNLDDSISKKDLFVILKKYGRLISIQDLMETTSQLHETITHVHERYHEKFLQVYVKSYILRLKEILDADEGPGKIDGELFTNSIVNLKHQFHKEQDTGKDTKFPLIYVLTSIFSTFIKEEPIHPVGSEFPGNLKIYEENGIFYCPVKDAQKDNPEAVCKFCLAEQSSDI